MTPLLQPIPLFVGFSSQDLNLFEDCAEEVKHPAGTCLMISGEPVEALYYIRRGEVTIKVLDADRIPTMVSAIGRGAMAGWSAIIPPYHATATVTAITDVELIRLDGEILKQRMQEHPAAGQQLLLNVSAMIASRLTEARCRLITSMERRAATN